MDSVARKDASFLRMAFLPGDAVSLSLALQVCPAERKDLPHCPEGTKLRYFLSTSSSPPDHTHTNARALLPGCPRFTRRSFYFQDM